MSIKGIIPTIDLDAAKETAELAVESAGTELDITIVHDEAREGYTRTVNQGLKAIEPGDHVVLLNEDVRMTHGWLHILATEVDRRDALGVWFAGPSGPCRTEPQCLGRPGDKRRPRIVDHVAGFCLFIKAEAFEKLGLLDERFQHYASDVDYQWRGAKLGKRVLWVPGVYADHELHDPQQEWWNKDHALLNQKWF